MKKTLVNELENGPIESKTLPMICSHMATYQSFKSLKERQRTAYRLLLAMTKAEMWEELQRIVRSSPNTFLEMEMPRVGTCLSAIMKKRQYTLVAEIIKIVLPFKSLERFESLEQWCIKTLEAPELLGIMKSLSMQGLLPNHIGELFKQNLWLPKFKEWIEGLDTIHLRLSPEDRLLRAIYVVKESVSLEDAAKLVLKKGVPEDIQMKYIDHVFRSFMARAKAGLKPKAMLEQIKEMLEILGENSRELREKLRPYTARLLSDYISKLDDRSIASLELFKPSVPYNLSFDGDQAPIGPFKNMILFDTYAKDREQLKRCILRMPAYQVDRLYCLFANDMIPEAKACLEQWQMKKEKKAQMIFEDFMNLLAYHYTRKKNDLDYQWQAPDSIVDIIELAKDYGYSLADISLAREAILLYPFREQESIRKVAAIIIGMWENEIKKHNIPTKINAQMWRSCLRRFCWLFSLQRYCEIVEIELQAKHKYGDLNTFMKCLEQKDDWPDDWFEEAIGIIDDWSLYDDEQDDGLFRLLRLALLKGTKSQVKTVLSHLNADILAQCSFSGRMPSLPIVRLYKAMKNSGWSKTDMHRVIASQKWQALSVDDLSAISPCMLNDDAFLRAWCDTMLTKLLHIHADANTIRAIIEAWPELDLGCGITESIKKA